MKLSIAAIFKNEHPYIIEWLAYHRLVGFDQFIIADNISDDGSTELLKALDEVGLIQRIEYPTRDNKGPQVPAYNEMLNLVKGRVDLLAFIDADEFVVPAQGTSVREYLAPFMADDCVGAIAVNWAIYGSSGKSEFRDEPVSRRFTQRARQVTGVNRHIKTIVKPEFCAQMLNPHKAALKKGRYIKSNGEPFAFSEHNEHGCSTTVDWSPLRINHYVVKSFEEFKQRKQKRGRASVSELRKDGFFKAHDMNHETSHIMERFQEPLAGEIQQIRYQLNLLQYKKELSVMQGAAGKFIARTGALGRWLDRQPEFSLVPYSDVKPASGEYRWEATGKDPAFMLKHSGAVLHGWYMLTVSVKGNLPQFHGKLYINDGEGMGEESAVYLPLHKGKAVKRVCYFPKPVKGLRFDPTEEIALFNVEALSFSKLTPGFARQLMLKKVSSFFPGDFSYLTRDELVKRYSLCFRHSSSDTNYSEWLQWYDESRFHPIAIERRLAQLKSNVRFSIIIQIAGDERVVPALVESLFAQVYRHFEVMIIAYGGNQPSALAIASQFEQYGIKCQVLTKTADNGEDLNSACQRASGEYLVVPDPALALSALALLSFAEAISSNASGLLPIIVYGDQDRIDHKGMRHTPDFKSGWNPDLLLAQDYISDCIAIHRQALNGIGGFRSGITGYEVYDVVLRVCALANDQQVKRVPEMVSHRYSSNRQGGEQKHSGNTAIKVRKDYLATVKNVNAEVVYLENKRSYRVIWPLPIEPLVSLIIPTRNGYEILKQCVDSILAKTSYRNFEILIIDNQSDCAQTLAYLDDISRHKQVSVYRYDDVFNYSAINNFAVEKASGDVVGLINNDVEIINPDWLREMVSQAMRPDIGCVGAMLYYANDTIQHAGVISGLGGVAGHSHKHFRRGDAGFQNRLNCVQNLSAVTAAALLVKKAIYREVGGLDAENLLVAFNDVDFCLKVRQAGYRNLWTSFAELYHHESVSRGQDDTPEKKARFEQEYQFMKNKWAGKLASDPYYHPNLTQRREDFSLNFTVL
ncbi:MULTISPECIES: glycosyltransferase [unclassified Endozoicomonas]|uniref:glycosyltransferase n=1 Tax=unclassified Endozoicomonas TaxID=2644528 RepID=UPI003BB5566D